MKFQRTQHRGFGHGKLRWVVLYLIKLKPRHGYELIKSISDMTQGQYSPSTSMIYPLLNDLQKLGLIEQAVSFEDERKQPYQITVHGLKEIESHHELVDEILKRIEMRSLQPQSVIESLHLFRSSVQSLLANRVLNAQEAETFSQTLQMALIHLQPLMKEMKMTTTIDKKPYRVRHELKLRVLTVLKIEKLSASLIRIVFQGDDLADFKSDSFDDHIKLFFPDPQSATIALPELTAEGLKFTGDTAPIARDYTPRHFDLSAQTLTVDFVIHNAGPATQWAQQAQVGDQLAIGGPRGSMVIPLAYQHYVLIGDETALPAIARRLEELPASAKATVLVEVDSTDDEIEFTTKANANIEWLHRNGQDNGEADLFIQAITALDLTNDDYFIWIAAETQVARKLRQLFIEQHQVDKAFIKAAGYWQHGKVSSHSVINDD
ncbi:MAG: siderophore-interacting protein [Acinetobacter sp.]